MVIHIAVSSATYYPTGAEDIVTVTASKTDAIKAARAACQDVATVVEADPKTGRVAIVWRFDGKQEDLTRRERHGDSWWTAEERERYLRERQLEDP